MDLRHLSLEKSQSFMFKPLKIAFPILSGSHDLPNAAAEQECQIQEYKSSQKLHEIKKILVRRGGGGRQVDGWPFEVVTIDEDRGNSTQSRTVVWQPQ